MNPVGAFQFAVLLSPSAAKLFQSTAEGTGGLQAKAGEVTPMRFAEVSGIDAGVEIETYQEGGRNANPLRFTRWGQFSNLVFRRGVTADYGLWDWYFDVQSKPHAPPRQDGFVLLQANTAGTDMPGIGGQPIAAWFFSNGLPEKLTGPTLDAARNAIAIETLEIAHEGILRLQKRQIPGLEAFLSQVGGSKP